MNNLSNKVAYITGGSKGIGYGIAKVLVEFGNAGCHYQSSFIISKRGGGLYQQRSFKDIGLAIGSR